MSGSRWSCAQRGQYCAGFTHVELVTVITVLGLLAASAIPRVAGLQGDARLAAVQGAAGATRSAAEMNRALLAARGYPDLFTGVPAGLTDIHGQPLAFVNGYPAATVIAELAGLTGNAGSGLPEAGYLVAPASGGMRRVQADAARIDCAFVYREAVPGASPTVSISASPADCS